MSQGIQNSIASIAICVYVAVLILLQLLLTAPGDRVPLYALLTAIAAIATLSDNFKLRWCALAGIVLALALLAHDYYAGIALRERLRQVEQVKSSARSLPEGSGRDRPM